MHQPGNAVLRKRLAPIANVTDSQAKIQQLGQLPDHDIAAPTQRLALEVLMLIVQSPVFWILLVTTTLPYAGFEAAARNKGPGLVQALIKMRSAPQRVLWFELVPVGNPGFDQTQQIGAAKARLETADLKMAGVMQLTEQKPLPHANGYPSRIQRFSSFSGFIAAIPVFRAQSPLSSGFPADRQ
ncbi:MAG: hypothetical protein CVV27_03620 [Candidatus Melainabacteria bacterium HGW-Melainabacteria-1]|nr:MAG: hypothetical protein CVV27_03620 [Candidatus Melainabacteria bacterium HGW-Melainabacteria-1]